MKKYIFIIIAATLASTACVKKLEPVLELSSDYKKLEFSAKYAHVIIPVKCNLKNGFNAYSTVDWANCIVKNDSLIVYIEKNKSTQKRKGTLTISAIGVEEPYSIEIEQNTGEYNTVYIAGYCKEGDKHIAALWKDGEIIKLSQVNSSANAVYMDNGNINRDIYVAGSESGSDNKSKAVVWKNGEKKNLLYNQPEYNTRANSVFVYNGNVYVVGYANFNEIGGGPTSGTWTHIHALLWTNDEVRRLQGSYDYDQTWASSVYASGYDVFVTGYTRENSPQYPYSPRNRAICWHNGYDMSLQGVEYSNYASSANSVYSGYIAGHYNNHPACWDTYSGDRLILDADGKNGTANAVFYNNTGYYIAGKVDDCAVLWINGAMQQLSNVSSSANSVFATDEGDVYVLGYESSDVETVYVLWKNGVKQELQDFYSSNNALFVN